MAFSQVQRIEKLLANLASIPTIQQKQKKFKSVNLTLSRIINKMQITQLQLKTKIKNENKYENAVSESKTEASKQAKRQRLAQTDKTEQLLRKELKEILITGYEVIMIIRQAITNEKIEYNFLIQTGKNTFVSSKTQLAYKQLMEMTSLEGVSSGRYQLRFKNLTDFIEKQQNKINYQYEEFVENNPTTAFSAFYRFFTDERLHKKWKLNNFGTFSEAYHYWYQSHGNEQIPSNEQILQAFRYSKSGGGTSGAFYRGGDVNNISQKAQSLSQAGNPGRPALTQLSAIRNGLLEIREGINSFINKEDYQTLEKIFSVSRQGEKIENAAFQYGKEQVLQIASQFNKT